jgi:glycosyltransferase involved in cell wall biosynthesis
MRIGLIADRSGPFYKGGVEERIWNFARHLSRRHEVRVFTTLAEPEVRVEDVTFIRVAPPLNQGYGAQVRSRSHEFIFGLLLAIEWLHGWDPDVVLVEALPYLHLLGLRRRARTGGFRYVLTVDEAWNEYGFLGTRFRTPADGLISLLLRIGVHDADEVVSVSRTTAWSLEQNYNAKGVTVVPNGINLADYHELQPGYAARPHEFDVVSVGRLEPIKRPEDLIRALAIMKDRFHWSGKAAIVGSGTLMNRLRDLSEKLSLSQQVEMLGFVSEKRRRDLLSRSRVFVLCSEREGFSISTLEALAAGVPAIVAKPAYLEVFGVSDIVSEGFNGVYYPVGDTKALAETLWSLLGDEPTLSRMSIAATAFALQYDWKVVTESLEKVLLRGMGGHDDRGPT